MFEIACTEPRQLLNYCFIKTAIRSSRFHRGELKDSKIVQIAAWVCRPERKLASLVRPHFCAESRRASSAARSANISDFRGFFRPQFHTLATNLFHVFVIEAAVSIFPLLDSILQSVLMGKLRSQFFMHFLSLPAKPLMKFMQSLA